MDEVSPLNPRDGDAPGTYHNGNPATGDEGSIPVAEFFQSVVEEFMAVFDGVGFTPAANDNTQLWQAIQAAIQASAPVLSAEAIYADGVTFAGGVVDTDVVYWDAGNSRYDEALSGTHLPAGMADVTNSRIYFAGKLPTAFLSGLTVGAYYLSDSTAGDITVTAPASDPIEMGKALAADEFYLDIDATGSALATKLIAGLVVLATTTEGANGVDDAKAITAKVLKYVLDNRTASDTVTGLVKLVTAVDILSSSSTTLAVSPSALKALTSTTGRRGIVELASNSETQSGADSVRAVTPAALASLTATANRKGLISLDEVDARIQSLIDASIAAHLADEGITHSHVLDPQV